MIVADEPTGSLDQESENVVFDLLAGLVSSGTTVLLITHDEYLAERTDRVIAMLDGRVDGSTPSVSEFVAGPLTTDVLAAAGAL